jgi:EAL domain-containing protein (putative c-di-GMP-specific phosphodiesterase class I)
VGDEKTPKLLEKAGVSYMQGYFFGAPELAKPNASGAVGELG